jgi:GR25 family glycosyltransferase involved in LPS biosynthesis
MIIGINCFFQHSFFSSGIATVIMTLADGLASLGHKPVLINTNGTVEWYDDCHGLKDKYPRRNMVDWSEKESLDLFIDIDGFLNPVERRRLSKRVAVFVRKPPFLVEQENSVYPISQPVKNLRDCDMVLTWAEFGDLDAHLLELLSNKPVYRLPFIWSPSGSHIYSQAQPLWSDSSKLVEKDFPWTCHIAETNMSMASNATLPIVIMAYAKTHLPSIAFKQYFVHNSVNIEAQQFFKENILAHTRRDDLIANFVGRQRIGDWRAQPKCFILSHSRFLNIKGLHLDSVWNGIPIIHNSSVLKNLGCGLERLYYIDNSVTGATKAIENMNEDFLSETGFFTPGNLNVLRGKILETFDIKKHAGLWSSVLEGTAHVPQIKSKLVVGFSDLWQNANCTYNFWVLLLKEACKSIGVEVEGVEINESNLEAQIDLLFFGPFGDTWTRVSSVPKVHITGENSPSKEGVLNLGFDATDLSKGRFRFPLWAQYIDWFGADQDRLVNPKTLPVDSLLGTHKVGDRKKFCAFIVTNPTNNVRNEHFQWLSQYKEVDSAGRLFNNVGDVLFVENGGGGGGELIKHEFLKQYKFCFAYENSRREGYVTEKMLAAKAAGCVPLYWGDLSVKKDFPDGFLDCNNFTNPADLIEAVKAIDENDAEWERLAKPNVNIQVERERLATVAKLVLEKVLTPEQVRGLPNVLGGATTAEAQELGKKRGDLVEKPIIGSVEHGKKMTSPSKNVQHNGKKLLVTCATQNYLASLLRWLDTTKPRLNADVGGRVYIGDDVTEFTYNLLRSDYPEFEFLRLPTNIKAPFFDDLWAPQHFAWKLWIYQQLVQEESLADTLVWYMDCASVIVRWPNEWLDEASREGLCMLEDAEQVNEQWCHDAFRRRMATTPQELSAQQIVGGIMAFVCGSRLAWKVFTEAWILGQQPDIIKGPKWAGVKDGKPFGHRHDQSILSILRLRHKVPVKPLASVYNHESLRRTFKSGACLYIHRGQYREHENFAPRIGEVHLINLARRQDRIQRFKENHEDWTKKVCLRPAFDGRQMTLTPALARLFAPNDFLWKKAIAGCALSHLSLWIELANEEASCENYLILEDDVKFHKGWLEQWNLASQEIPEDYDVLYLGGVLPPNRAAFKSVLEQVNGCWSRILPNQIFGQREPNSYFHFCNYSYILSRAGARKILDEIQRRGGYYTSADHMVCNRVEDMKHYIMTPMVAGCYQDEDPKYQTSAFNNFNRVDAFDSDLWNNDERFEPIDAKIEGPVPILQALHDARLVKTQEKVAAAAFYTVGSHAINPSALLEYKWLESLIGEPLKKIEVLPLDHTPRSKAIFIIMKPHFEEYLPTFQKYEALGISFSAIHLSDEFCNDPVDWYNYSACKGVVRMYPRSDVPQEKTLTVPLGPYRIPEEKRGLQGRSTVWSFFGTKWKDREALLEPLKGIVPNTHAFYDSWMDAKQLSADEYSKISQSSLFVLCPRGQNVETFRFYEALEHGAIPIYVRDQGDDAYFAMISKNLPVVPLQGWVQASGFIQNIVKNPEVFSQYYNEMGVAWARWKVSLKKEVYARLDLQ